jgi:Carbohydrate-selective porin, OprB family/S-layer homology domain
MMRSHKYTKHALSIVLLIPTVAWAPWGRDQASAQDIGLALGLDPSENLLAVGAPLSGTPSGATSSGAILASEMAQAEITQEEITQDGLEQVTAVSQLKDVQPTDWAYQALQSLVERYGCLSGGTNQTFQGDRALTRDEFAAGLNACLNKIQALLAERTADFAQKADLENLKKLLEDFAPELAIVRGRVDILEVRTDTLKNQQFSTTTKLFGQAIAGIQGHNSPNLRLGGFPFNDKSSAVNVITNVQLSLYTAFNPRSLLFTGLQAGSGQTSSQALTNNLLLGYESNTNATVQLSDLTFRQLIGDRLAVIAGTQGVNMVTVFRGANRIESAGQGALSFLAQRNPIANLGSNGGNGSNAGVGFDWQLAPRWSMQGVYFTNRPNDSAQGGLFGGENGSTTIAAQLAIAPTNTLDFTLQYANAYSASGYLGTGTGDDQVALPTQVSPFVRSPIRTNAIGATLAWRLTPRVTLGGWAGYTTSALKGSSSSVDTLNWMAFVNLPDLFGAGNLGAIYLGQPPAIVHSDLPLGRNVPDFVNGGNLAAAAGGQPGRTTHLELFYRLRVNDMISVTPGVIVIFNPNHNPDNGTITMGVVRTTFSF